MNKTRRWMFLAVIAVVIAGLGAIAYVRSSTLNPAQPKSYVDGSRLYRLERSNGQQVYVSYVQPEELEGGVYRFRLDGDYLLWGRSLGRFAKEHQDLRITSQGISGLDSTLGVTSMTITTERKQ